MLHPVGPRAHQAKRAPLAWCRDDDGVMGASSVWVPGPPAKEWT